MKWLTYVANGRETFGCVIGDGVTDIGARSDFNSLKEAIADGALPELSAGIGENPDHSLSEIIYLPTITAPDKILCVGLNYKDNQEETGQGG